MVTKRELLVISRIVWIHPVVDPTWFFFDSIHLKNFLPSYSLIDLLGFSANTYFSHKRITMGFILIFIKHIYFSYKNITMQYIYIRHDSELTEKFLRNDNIDLSFRNLSCIKCVLQIDVNTLSSE